MDFCPSTFTSLERIFDPKLKTETHHCASTLMEKGTNLQCLALLIHLQVHLQTLDSLNLKMLLTNRKSDSHICVLNPQTNMFGQAEAFDICQEHAAQN